jgi:hypothetical protein
VAGDLPAGERRPQLLVLREPRRQELDHGGEKNSSKQGAASKPTFDKFNGVYYLGWQERTQVDKVNRSVFNIDVSKDGRTWERKYRFETTKSFQYPTFASQDQRPDLVQRDAGDSDPSRKERIMFGRLEQASGPSGVLLKTPRDQSPHRVY